MKINRKFMKKSERKAYNLLLEFADKNKKFDYVDYLIACQKANIGHISANCADKIVKFKDKTFPIDLFRLEEIFN